MQSAWEGPEHSLHVGLQAKKNKHNILHIAILTINHLDYIVPTASDLPATWIIICKTELYLRMSLSQCLCTSVLPSNPQTLKSGNPVSFFWAANFKEKYA